MTTKDIKEKLALAKAKKTNMTFEQFAERMQIAVYFSDKMDSDEIFAHMSDWYVMFKKTKHQDEIEWIKEHLQDVNRNTHDFWLDMRGLLLLELDKKSKMPLFPTF